MKNILKTVGIVAAVVAVCFVILVGTAVYNMLTGNNVSLEFELTEDDYVYLEEAALNFENAVLSGEGELSLSVKSADFVTAYLWIDTQYSIAYLDYCQDMTDESTLENYKFAFEMRNSASNLYSETLKNILLSDSEYADVLFEGWSEEEKNMLLQNNDRIYELRDENESLLIEYRALDPYAEGWEETVDGIYLQVVGNYNAMAKEYGYSNYYEYSSAVECRRDYSGDDRASFRQYVKSYIVPLYEESYDRFMALYESADESTLNAYKAFSKDDYGDNAEVQALISDYIEGVFRDSDRTAQSVGNNMKKLFDRERAIFANGDDALDAAYTAYLSYYDEPIVYFGPGYQDMLTVVHEMGHYAAFGELGGINTPLDICEVQSQANEWMFISYLEDKVDPAVYELLLLARLTRGFENIILATAVDECEERIYSSELASEETCAAIISEVVKTYGEELSEELRMGFYFRYVAVDNPVYYISYATSELASVSHYIKAQTDPEGAKDAYVRLIKTTDYQGFKEGLDRCGFLDPFSEETFKSIAETFAVNENEKSEGEDAESGTVYVIFDTELPLAA